MQPNLLRVPPLLSGLFYACSKASAPNMPSEHRISDLIALKRDGDVLSEDQIELFIRNVISKDEISEAQMGAMLMAIYLKGMTREEELIWTKVMAASGETLEWPKEWGSVLADKHSTGGVGDKVSLVLAPALAVCGLKVPMISGRGLTHTGGTLDKLESIPGFNVNLSMKQILDVVSNVGCCIVNQSETLAPADSKLYSIRDVTGTVHSIPLIASSIVSKKAAENIKFLVVDVKCGRGGLPQEKAFSLAQLIINSCRGLGISATAVLSNMDAPLGYAIGNSLEVSEAINCLNGKGPEDLLELVCEEGGLLLKMTGKVASPGDGKKQIRQAIASGSALKKFQDMIIAQGVKENVAKELCTPSADGFKHLPLAKHKTELATSKSGVITAIDSLVVGEISNKLGAGRLTQESSVDHGVGLVMKYHVGQHVKKGEPWVVVYHNGNLTEAQKSQLQGAIAIDENASANLPLASRIIDVVDSERSASIMVCQ